jgi:hypothetical protein
MRTKNEIVCLQAQKCEMSLLWSLTNTSTLGNRFLTKNDTICFYGVSLSRGLHENKYRLRNRTVGQLTISKARFTIPALETSPQNPHYNHDLIYVKDEKAEVKTLIDMDDKTPKLDVFKLEEVELDGTKDASNRND